MNDVAEVVVIGPSGPDVSDLCDLSGEAVYVRRSSSYYRSMTRLSDSLSVVGAEPVRIVAVNEFLEDEDLLE